jgi:hypothetical protein
VVANGPVQGAQFGNDNVQVNSFGPVQGDVVQVAGNYTVQQFGEPAAAAPSDMAPALPPGTIRHDELIRAAA